MVEIEVSNKVNDSRSIEVPLRETVSYEKRQVEIINYGDDISEDFERSFPKRKLVVKDILECSDKSRENDVILFLDCINLEFPEVKITDGKTNIHITIPKKLFKFIPSPETYTRARRYYQNKLGDYLPKNEKVLERRKLRQIEIKEYFK